MLEFENTIGEIPFHHNGGTNLGHLIFVLRFLPCQVRRYLVPKKKARYNVTSYYIYLQKMYMLANKQNTHLCLDSALLSIFAYEGS